MLLLFISFLAGALTVLAPCVLPILPVIIGGSVQGGQKRNPYLITGSLAVAIVLFTLALKFSTAFINIPPDVWNAISGGILILFGLISLFPQAWDSISNKLRLSNRSEKLLVTSRERKTRLGDILIGLSLGPVFSSCSPTYFLILATVLPRNLATGIAYLIAYALGLSLVLLLISLLGQRFIQKAKFAANPNGWFKRGLGVLFILVGIFILSGADKKVQTAVLESGFFNITNVEQSILRSVQKNIPDSAINSTSRPDANTASQSFPQYREVVRPSGFVNATSVKLGDLIGKKVILVDFMTYSCINCIRTFPYLNAWYDKYKDQGFEIVGIHTPEFAFEKNLNNVRAAMQRYGIKFPVVLDNDYATWGAYENNYWPRKYLIDLNGRIVYDHIGEGNYEETEEKIQELLRTRSELVKPTATDSPSRNQSPETYFGANRNEPGNFVSRKIGEQLLSLSETVEPDTLYLVGRWNFDQEWAENTGNAEIQYMYRAKNVFFVASSQKNLKVKVHRDGKPLTRAEAGTDVVFEGNESYVVVQEERLYHLIRDLKDTNEHLLQLEPTSAGLKAYTFTFG